MQNGTSCYVVKYIYFHLRMRDTTFNEKKEQKNNTSLKKLVREKSTEVTDLYFTVHTVHIIQHEQNKKF